MQIRMIRESDAADFLCLCKTLDGETQFMLLEPGERSLTVTAQRHRIREVLAAANQAILVVEHESRLIGYLGAFGGAYRRNWHSAYITVGIMQAFTGQGIGTALFRELEQWARQQRLHRLELEVMAHNRPGIALYKNMGFEVEGLKKDALLIDGAYVDEYAMAKLLEYQDEA